MVRKYTRKFSSKLVELLPALKHDALLDMNFENKPEGMTGVEIFSQMSYDDLWEDAKIVEVCLKLRASKSLRIPSKWRQHLPSHL